MDIWHFSPFSAPLSLCLSLSLYLHRFVNVSVYGFYICFYFIAFVQLDSSYSFFSSLFPHRFPVLSVFLSLNCLAKVEFVILTGLSLYIHIDFFSLILYSPVFGRLSCCCIAIRCHPNFQLKAHVT